MVTYAPCRCQGKGDLPHLLLAFPSSGPNHFTAWVDSDAGTDPVGTQVECTPLAEERTRQLERTVGRG